MACERYQRFNFTDATLMLIDTMNQIIREYQEQGFTLTVRQLYYQLVARDIIPNNERSYKRTTCVANDGRLAGLIDWDAIEDRTREFIRRTRWASGADILKAAADSYHVDMWFRQPRRVFCIIEKEALVGVLEPTCASLDVPLLAARGYPSGTVLREFAIEDILPNVDDQQITVLHLGDHDPSGIDMTRDLQERLRMFCREPVELVRLALTMEQVEERRPPPNPAKTTDSRFASYLQEYGSESWELDALPPQYLAELVEREVIKRIDARQWQADQERVADTQRRIREVAKEFNAT